MRATGGRDVDWDEVLCAYSGERDVFFDVVCVVEGLGRASDVQPATYPAYLVGVRGVRVLVMVSFEDTSVSAVLPWRRPQSVEARNGWACVVTEDGSGGGLRAEILDDEVESGEVLGCFPDGVSYRGSVEFEELADPFDFVVSKPVVQGGEHFVGYASWSTVVVLVKVVKDGGVIVSQGRMSSSF